MPKRINKKEILDRLLKVDAKPLDEPTAIHSKMRFECLFCGGVFVTTPYKIYSKETRSCGCVALGKRKGNDFISGTYFSCIKQHAKARNLEFDITIDYITKLLISQEFRCKLSNRPIEIKYEGIKNGDNTASLDRIDNTIGYVKGNLQWLHKDVNKMKHAFKQEEFIKLCLEISKNVKH